LTRKTPRLEGGSIAGLEEFALSDQQIASISAKCGLPIDSARNGVEQALRLYLHESLAQKTAPTVASAEALLNVMLKLATELQELNTVPEGDDPESLLKGRVRQDLDWPDSAATRLQAVLVDYVRAVERARNEVSDERNSQRRPSRHLAQRLAMIWEKRLGQPLTLSPSSGGSPFARFVMEAVACLPRDWPWCPGRPRPHSLEAFVQAVRRDLHGYWPAERP
jgi:hypothetical protein